MVGERGLSTAIAGVSGVNGRHGGDGPARDRAAQWIDRLAPETLPPGVERTVRGERAQWYRVRLGYSPLTVVLEIELWHGELWAHLAVTGRLAAPALAQLAWCRDVFLRDRKAIQMLPRRAEAFEAGLRTLHIYSPLENDTLPTVSRPSHLEPVT